MQETERGRKVEKKKENLKLEETKEKGDGVEAWICHQKKEGRDFKGQRRAGNPSSSGRRLKSLKIKM